MDPDKSLEDLFSEALERNDTVERARFLDAACGGDAALRTQVEKLIRAHEEAAGFLLDPSRKSPPAGSTLVAQVTAQHTEKVGDTIGRYKLLQQIGEGGCGVVYMAEQEEAVRRRVALKVIKLGMDTKQVIARFEAERQALALMDHPNIAKFFDAGVTGSPDSQLSTLNPQLSAGRPYFVMELIRGARITDFCDEHKVSTEERLKLFIQVCQAIQHAHQKGVIHRDIKPSNILVTVNDGVPIPKVIDFGIAKATQGRLTDNTLFTAFEQFIGTPAYTSPEQAMMTTLDIDTRSDIYSLGVLLYELLTGRPPFDQKELLAAGLDEMRRTIREKEPPKPSTRLSSLGGAELTTTAQRRQTEAPRLVHLVKGDLDWIVMKCLEKDRARRYETANGLATDLQRHLRDEPIAARPPTHWYELQKTVRRHRGGFAAGAALVFVLAAGVVGSLWQAIRATQAEREQVKLRQKAEGETKRAETEAARSEQVAKFMKEMLKGAGPSVARGRDATVLREILAQAATRIGKELRDQPEVQGDLWLSIGNTYAEIGDSRRAVTNLQHAVDSYRRAFGSAHAKLALALALLGQSQSRDSDLSLGRANAALGLDMARNLGGPENLAKCLALAARTDDPWFIFENGATLLREAIALRRQLGTNEENLIALADCMGALSRSDACGDTERETMGREALALFRQHLGNDDPKTANAAYGHGQRMRRNGNFEEAEQILREAVNSFSKLYDKNYPHRGFAIRFLAETLIAQGKRAQAEDLASQAKDWCLLGSINAYHGEWEHAGQQFSRAHAPDFMAIALRNLGEEKEYSQLRRNFLDKAIARHEFGNELSARPFLLLPVAAEDLKRLEQFAELTVPSNLPVWLGPKLHLAIAMAEYRLGRFDVAAASATNAITADTRSENAAQSWFIQALAFGRTQQIRSARTAFAKGDELVARLSRDTREDFLEGWYEWAIAESLSREAKALLESTPDSAK